MIDLRANIYPNTMLSKADEYPSSNLLHFLKCFHNGKSLLVRISNFLTGSHLNIVFMIFSSAQAAVPPLKLHSCFSSSCFLAVKLGLYIGLLHKSVTLCVEEEGKWTVPVPFFSFFLSASIIVARNLGSIMRLRLYGNQPRTEIACRLVFVFPKD